MVSICSVADMRAGVVPVASSNLCGDGRWGVMAAGAGATCIGVMCAVGEIGSGDERMSSGGADCRGVLVGAAVRSALVCPVGRPVVAMGPMSVGGCAGAAR